MTYERSKKQYQRWKDRETVSGMLGRELGLHEVLHHHTDRVLILCANEAQHRRIHQEMDAVKACGYKDWRRCKFCGKYDNPDNLYIGGRNRNDAYHRECSNKYRKLNRQNRVEVIE